MSDSKVDISPVYYEATLPQKVAAGGSIIFALLSVIFIYIWMKGTDTTAGFEGGLNWEKEIFNWHPIFMSMGMILFGISASVTYRIVPLSKSVFTKNIHGFLHLAALCCVIVGLTCVIIYNDYPDHHTGGGYYDNLATLHDYLGLTAIALYFQNYVVGIVMFLLPVSLIPIINRKQYLPYHRFLGRFSIIAAVIAAETGLMELYGYDCTGYSLTSPDNDPASHYYLITAGCKIANGAAILMICALLLFCFSVYEMPVDKKVISNLMKQGTQSETQYLLAEENK